MMITLEPSEATGKPLNIFFPCIYSLHIDHLHLTWLHLSLTPFCWYQPGLTNANGLLGKISLFCWSVFPMHLLRLFLCFVLFCFTSPTSKSSFQEAFQEKTGGRHAFSLWEVSPKSGKLLPFSSDCGKLSHMITPGSRMIGTCSQGDHVPR